MERKNLKSLYLIGILCLLPLIGAFVGIFLLLFGIFKYKDKWLIIIGSAGILITVIVYTSLFYDMKYSTSNAKGFAKLSQEELNTLAKQIEFYKFQTGDYPDSLEELKILDRTVNISDPLILRLMDNKIQSNYYYQKLSKNQYTLFSSGINGIPKDSDDLYPIQYDTSQKIKPGFVR